MDRTASIKAIDADPSWDIIVIGGGATGLGAAVDAAARGYRTVLLEQGDFAQGTSSRSTKLIHGGLRYLRQGNIGLVRQALYERGLLLQNAPHLVRSMNFVIPYYARWERPFYGAGLKLYDFLAGSRRLGASRFLNLKQTLAAIPTINPEGLRGGAQYYDSQFDDARLAIALARTFTRLGGVALNYFQVCGFKKSGDRLSSVVGRDRETGLERELAARVVINATGAYCDQVRQMDHPESAPMIAPSQGAHIVLDRRFLPGNSALMIPRTEDGRVLFAIPWHERVLIGTTETPMTATPPEPRPFPAEIDYLLQLAAHYLVSAPSTRDILSAFAGLRPLVRRPARSSAALPRDHTILISASGLVTVTGGKWTTYRKMGEDAVDAATKSAKLPVRPSTTATLRLDDSTPMSSSDSPRLDPNLNDTEDDVHRAVREEMARTVEDVLARRTRALFLDAKASVDAAPRVAKILATELGRDSQWEESETATFRDLGARYLP